MSKLTSFMTFATGVAIGSVVTWYFVKDKYAKLAQEEIDSVKEVYGRKFAKEEPVEDTDISEEKPEPEEKKPVDIKEYATRLQKEGYTNYANILNEKLGDKAEKSDKPYVIAPEDFGEGEYTTISLTYYADGILADDDDQIIDNVDELVGADFADHFGDYEDDSVHIRNERLHCEYEVLRSLRTYEEVLRDSPYKAGV